MKGTVIIEQARGFFARNPILTYILIGIILALIVYYLGKKRGEDKVPVLPEPVPNPTPGPGQDNSYNPGVLTDRLYQEIEGMAWVPRNEEPFKTLLSLPDWQFRAVAQDWQKRYFKKIGDMTLLQAIGNETSVWDTFKILRDSILKRGQELGLI